MFFPGQRVPGGCGATLFGVAGSANAKLRREAVAEILALRIFNQANGEAITRRVVEAQLTQWRSHPPGCRCDAPCDLADTVSVSRVWCVVWGWQASIARTRRLAQR
jgi:hypothetical protein